MNIKEMIGSRITKARKDLGITIKELAIRVESLSAARISNWEQGTRSPGPIEAKLLAEHLKVSPAWILCLTDNPQGELSMPTTSRQRQIPILNMQDIRDIHIIPAFDPERTVVIDSLNKSNNQAFLFAVLMEDNSMEPVLNTLDLAIINPELTAKPGDFVLAYLKDKQRTVLRKYSETETCLFQLLANNDLWATVPVRNFDDVIVIGVVVECRRYL